MGAHLTLIMTFEGHQDQRSWGKMKAYMVSYLFEIQTCLYLA